MEVSRAQEPRYGGMRQVAAEAGVSVSTVSNVLNSPEIVAPETRRRVEDAMARVGYVRNGAARRLRGVPSPVVGAVTLDMGNPFYGEVSRGVEDRLAEVGCMLLLCSTDARVEREKHHLRMLEEHGVRGVLFTPVHTRAAELRAMAARGTPVVLLDHPRPHAEMCAVTSDNILGGLLAVEHLLSLGHSRIAYLQGAVAARSVTDRVLGARKAVEAAGLDPDSVLVEFAVATSGGPEAAESALERVLAGPRPATALFCFNDFAALGVLRGLRRRGVRVPQDVSVVGYDDLHFAVELTPSLTTVRQSAYALGRAAADLLLDESRPGHRHQETLFKPELVVRASTASPPR